MYKIEYNIQTMYVDLKFKLFKTNRNETKKVNEAVEAEGANRANASKIIVNDKLRAQTWNCNRRNYGGGDGGDVDNGSVYTCTYDNILLINNSMQE